MDVVKSVNADKGTYESLKLINYIERNAILTFISIKLIIMLYLALKITLSH